MMASRSQTYNLECVRSISFFEKSESWGNFIILPNLADNTTQWVAINFHTTQWVAINRPKFVLSRVALHKLSNKTTGKKIYYKFIEN